MGFGIPMFEWFGNDLRDMFEKNFTKDEFSKHDLLNSSYIQKEFQNLKENKQMNINKLWLTLVFQLWYNKYMEKN